MEPIAVIGLSGRFPDAEDVATFWKNLCEARESVRTFSRDELLAAGVDRAVLDHPRYVRAGVVLDAIAEFDAAFFGFTPREAELTDPQHRVFLECAWEALEDAGWSVERTTHRVGVFAGVGLNNYFLLNVASRPGFVASLSELEKSLAHDKDYLATRVSHRLNLTGPSITIQTACSTSLVAVHLACQSLLTGESDMALAGGVSIRIPQIAGYRYEAGSTVSVDGHCRAFDADATGMVLGSGAGVVVVKRLSDALADGDAVRAVILSSCVNNDGAAKIGFTAPSVNAQADVIAEAHALAGVSADEIGYVEAHGTGTQLGDPVELAALTQAFRKTTDRTGYCAVGSVKTNIGHLDSAAGIAGLIKAVLCVETGQLPPSLNYANPNPHIDFQNSPFSVQRRLSDWNPRGRRRIAGVSSFGIGGTNAHVLVAEPPPRESSGHAPEWNLLTVSASTPAALEAATDRLAGHLRAHPDLNPADVAYTLQCGRRSFACRRAVVVNRLHDAPAALLSPNQAHGTGGPARARARRVAFMFPGQGSQYVNMGLDLYRDEPVYRAQIDSCCELLRERSGFELPRVLFPSAADLPDARERIVSTAIAQPAIFVTEYATARLWMSWGVEPTAMIGHSIGEYVAACLAGVFSLEDALTVVAERGRLMESMEQGSMLAVRIDPESLRERLCDDLSLAVINGPDLCVAAGATHSIRALERGLAREGIECRTLRTSHAFHSCMMDPALAPFRRVFDGIALRPPEIPFVSNVTGAWIEDDSATDPEYWVRHLRSTVAFSDGLARVLASGDPVMLEVGPGQVLSTFVRRHPAKSAATVACTSFGAPAEGVPERARMIESLGRMWCEGVIPDWEGFHAGSRRRRVPLPTYPFQRRRYWIEPGRPAVSAAAAGCLDPDDWEERMGAGGPVPDGHHPPAGEIEARVACIWRDLLGFDTIGRHDSFFELGGDSLLATKAVSRISDELGVTLPLDRFFQAPAVADVAALVESLRAADGSAYTCAELRRKMQMI